MNDVVKHLNERESHCLAKSKCHAHLAASAKLFSYMLGIPSALISALVGTSVYKGIEQDSDYFVLTIIASVSAAFLTALQTVLQPGSEKKLHSEAQKRYGKAIDIIQTTRTKFRHNENEFDISLLDEIDNLVQNARDIEPIIPDRVWKRFKSKNEG